MATTQVKITEESLKPKGKESTADETPAIKGELNDSTKKMLKQMSAQQAGTTAVDNESDNAEDNSTTTNSQARTIVDIEGKIAANPKIKGVVVDAKYFTDLQGESPKIKLETPWNVSLGMQLIALTEDVSREVFKSVHMTNAKNAIKKHGVLITADQIEQHKRYYEGGVDE